MLASAALSLVLLTASPGLDENPVFQAIRSEGLSVGGQKVTVPEPTFGESQSADEQRARLRAIAGSDRAAEELLRDSVTAPYRLQLRDVKTAEATIRSGDLYFAIHAELPDLDPADLVRGDATGPVEAGNIRFEARRLPPEELERVLGSRPDRLEWYIRATGTILDRIAVEETSRLFASRSPEALLVAGRTDPRFSRPDSRWPNLWRPVERDGKPGPPEAFAGGIGYVQARRWKPDPNVLIVEIHFAFAEPVRWFDGAPVLRSKLSLIAQDQIRRLRRELAQAKPRKPG